MLPSVWSEFHARRSVPQGRPAPRHGPGETVTLGPARAAIDLSPSYLAICISHPFQHLAPPCPSGGLENALADPFSPLSLSDRTYPLLSVRFFFNQTT